MSFHPTAHPDQDELISFGLGKLPPGENERIEQHLEACPDCCSTLLELQDDTFVGLVREAQQLRSATANVAATLDGLSSPDSSLPSLPAELRNHPRYEISGLLGRGGMGDVYKAQHKVMNRPVALKVIKPELIENETARQRFHREVQAAARLHDRNIVTAYDAEQAGGLHFLVMEYVEGVNLDEVVRQRGPLPVAQACDYIRQAAAGLQHAHELGMVHRDIKPHNLMLANTGEVKILDFGLANFASELGGDSDFEQGSGQPFVLNQAAPQLTQMGSMMGTPDYIAPEQALDAHAADIRADIYSLGCTFYTLLAARPPFGQRSVPQKIKAHCEEVAQPLSKFRNDVPSEVEAILLKMLAKNPAERFQSPAGIIEALARVPAQTQLSSPQVAEKLDRRGPRSAAAIALACLFLAAIAAATIFYIQTDFGVVRVEVADESLRIKIEGGTITAQDRDTTVVRIRPGNRTLIVTGPNFFEDDFKFETDSFQLRRGDKIALTVAIVDGEVVVHKDGKRFDSKPYGRSGPGGNGPDQPQDMQLLAELVGHTNVVRAVRFLPGDERLVSLDGNGDVIVWDATAQRMIRRFKVAGGTYTDGDISADGRFLAIGSDWGSTKGRLEIWDIAKGVMLHSLTHRFNYVEQIRFSPDGAKLVAVGSPPVAVLWDVTAGTELRTIDPGFNGQEVKSVAFSTDGLLVALGVQGQVRFHDAETGTAKGKIVLANRGIVVDLVSSPNRKYLAAMQGSGTIALIDTRSWSVAHTIDSPAGGEMSRSGAFLTNELLATGSDQGWLRLRKLDGALVAVAKTEAGSCLNVSVSSSGRQIVTGGGWVYNNTQRKWTVTSDFKVRLWQLPLHAPSEKPGSLPQLIEDMRLEGHEDFVLALDYTPDGTHLISGGAADHVLVSNARNSRRAGELVGHTRTVHALDVSPDGKSAAAAGKSGEILVWDLATKKIIQRLTGHTGWVECLAFSPDGQRIASGSSNWARDERDLTVRMWDVASGRQLWQSEAPAASQGQGQVFEVLFTPDQRRLVTVHQGPHDGISVWDAETGALERRFSGSHSSIKCADLSPDGRTLATGHEAVELRELAWDDSKNAVIRLWDFKTGQEIEQLAGHTGGIQSVKFSSDGRQLVSCSGGQFLHDEFRPQPSRDNTIRVWDLPSRRELFRQPLEKHGQAAVFSPDGRFIASSAGVFNEKPLVQIWRLPESVELQPAVKIGMNDDFGLLFEGRLVAPAELSRRLVETLKENPNRVVAIHLPKRPWTVAPHVDQLEQIARIAGARHITRPAWAESAVPAAVPAEPRQSSQFFQSLGDLQEIVRTRVDQYGGKLDGRPTSGPNRLRYDARVGGVDVKLSDSLFAELKSKAEAASVTVSHEENRDVQLRVFRYLAPLQRGEVAVTLKEIPAEDGLNWRLEIDVFEWPKGALTPNEVFVHYLRKDGGATIRLDGETVSREDLLKRLSEMARRNAGLRVLLDGDVVPFQGDVRELMQAIPATGIPERNVAFAPRAIQRLMDEALQKGLTVRANEITQAGNLTGHTDEIRDLEFFDGGKKLATGSADQTFRIWDVATKKEIYKRDCPHWVSAVAISPDGKLAALGYITTRPIAQVEVIDLETKERLHLLSGPPELVYTLDFSRDGNRLLGSGKAKTIVWNVQSGKKLYEAAHPDSAANILDASFSPDGSRIVTASGNIPHVSILDSANGQPVHVLNSPNKYPAIRAGYSSDGQQLVVAAGAEILVYDAKILDRRQTISLAGMGHVHQVRFLNFDRHLLVSGRDDVLRIFEVGSGKLVAEQKLDAPIGVKIAIAPDETLLATGGGIAKNLLTGRIKERINFTPRDYDVRLWRLPAKPSLTPQNAKRIVVELKDDGRFEIEGRSVNSPELLNRLQWVLKETPEREVHVLPAEKFSGLPFRNLVSLVRSAGGKHVTWPPEIDEKLLAELTGPELDPAIDDAVNELTAVFEKYLRTAKAKTAAVGEFAGALPQRVGTPLRTGVEKKLREAGWEIVAADDATQVFELSGEAYEVTLYKELPKLDIRWQIRSRKGKLGGNQGGSGAMTTYGRKIPAEAEKPENK